MGSFAYAQLEIDPVKGVRFRCTEPQTVQLVMDLAKTLVPGCKIANEWKRFSGDLLECRLEKLQNTYAMGWEILAYLGQLGWEAFAADRVSVEQYDQCYHLKLPTESSS